jgi:hypothetical protein
MRAPQFRVRTALVAVAMTAVALVSARMSVPEDRTFQGLTPLVCFVLLGIWASWLRGWNFVAGGVVGGVLGAVSNVGVQYFYYRYLHYDRFANVIYLGSGLCLIVDSIMGAIAGLLLGAAVWALFWLGAMAQRGTKRGQGPNRDALNS